MYLPSLNTSESQRPHPLTTPTYTTYLGWSSLHSLTRHPSTTTTHHTTFKLALYTRGTPPFSLEAEILAAAFPTSEAIKNLPLSFSVLSCAMDFEWLPIGLVVSSECEELEFFLDLAVEFGLCLDDRGASPVIDTELVGVAGGVAWTGSVRLIVLCRFESKDRGEMKVGIFPHTVLANILGNSYLLLLVWASLEHQAGNLLSRSLHLG